MWPGESNFVRIIFVQEKMKQRHLQTLIHMFNATKLTAIWFAREMYIYTVYTYTFYKYQNPYSPVGQDRKKKKLRWSLVKS